ncbi:hypothetical protein ABW21_db0203551 [Orbilia brochopaga]|nr:hypothetical protein ABW21_db0203551 [Drechslerella brochopaga]
MAVMAANTKRPSPRRRVTFHKDTKPGHKCYDRKDIPTDVFPFTVGLSSTGSAPGAQSLTGRSAPKYSFKSALRQPITRPHSDSGYQGSNTKDEMSSTWARSRSPSPDSPAVTKDNVGNRDANAQIRSTTSILKQDNVSLRRQKSTSFRRPPPLRTNLRVGGIGRIIKNSTLLHTITGLPTFHITPLGDGGGGDPEPPSGSPPPVAPPNPAVDYTLTLSNMLYQTRQNGGDQQHVLDLYQEAEAEFQRDLVEASGAISDALKAELQVFDDLNNQIALIIGRYEYSGWPEGQHSYWLYHTNASAPMFVNRSLREKCDDCTNWRFRLCPHWRRVVFHEGYHESTYTHGGNQSCPFCGIARGSQATEHITGCVFRMAKATDDDVNAPDDYFDGLTGDADFDDIRKESTAFDGKDPKDKGNEIIPATIEQPALSDDDSGSESGDIPPRTSPPPSPPRDSGRLEDAPVPEIAAGIVRPLTDKDQSANPDHYQQVQLVQSRSSKHAKSHHAGGVRRIAGVSAADRTNIEDICTAVKAKGLARPYWELKTYVDRGLTDFSGDTDFKQRLPDNVLENAALSRGQLNKPLRLSPTTNYTGPVRILFKGNEKWFQSRFDADPAAYTKWRAQTITFTDLQKAAPMNDTAPAHPTKFYTEDTLNGLYWVGDTGIMIQAPGTDKIDIVTTTTTTTTTTKPTVDPDTSKPPRKPETRDWGTMTDPIELPKPPKPPKLVKPAKPDGVSLAEHARTILEATDPPTGAKKGEKGVTDDGKSKNPRFRWCKFCLKRTDSLGKKKDSHFSKCWNAWAGDPEEDEEEQPEEPKDKEPEMRTKKYRKGTSFNSLNSSGSKRKAANDSGSGESSVESEGEDLSDHEDDNLGAQDEPEPSPETKFTTKLSHKRRRKVFKTPEFISSSLSATPTASDPPAATTSLPSTPSRKRKHKSVSPEETVRTSVAPEEGAASPSPDELGHPEESRPVHGHKKRKIGKEDKKKNKTKPEEAEAGEKDHTLPHITPKPMKMVNFDTPESQDRRKFKKYRKTPGAGRSGRKLAK